MSVKYSKLCVDCNTPFLTDNDSTNCCNRCFYGIAAIDRADPLPGNPKDVVGAKNVSMSVVPASAPDTSSGVRVFATGATRNLDDSKLDFDGFLSVLALEELAKYMHSHRQMANGEVRASDNWKQGIPLATYMKSAWRHFFDIWKLHNGLPVASPEDGHAVDLKEACCALLFNIQGYLHEVSQNERSRSQAHQNGEVPS